jgi:hypothetical protein
MWLPELDQPRQCRAGTVHPGEETRLLLVEGHAIESNDLPAMPLN